MVVGHGWVGLCVRGWGRGRMRGMGYMQHMRGWGKGHTRLDRGDMGNRQGGGMRGRSFSCSAGRGVRG